MAEKANILLVDDRDENLVAVRVAVRAVTVTSFISGARCAFPSGLSGDVRSK